MRRAGDDFSPADVDRKQTEMQTETGGGDGGGGGGRRTKDGWLPCRWDRLGLSDGGEGESRGEKQIDKGEREMWEQEGRRVSTRVSGKFLCTYQQQQDQSENRV